MRGSGGRGKSESARRRLRRLGDAAHLLGIRPWQWGLMTVEQCDHILDWLDAYEKAQDEAHSKVKN
ncbi:DUF2949 domain-containing protein [Streptomyces sp. NPDC003032]